MFMMTYLSMFLCCEKNECTNFYCIIGGSTFSIQNSKCVSHTHTSCIVNSWSCIVVSAGGGIDIIPEAVRRIENIVNRTEDIQPDRLAQHFSETKSGTQ